MFAIMMIIAFVFFLGLFLKGIWEIFKNK